MELSSYQNQTYPPRCHTLAIIALIANTSSQGRDILLFSSIRSLHYLLITHKGLPLVVNTSFNLTSLTTLPL